MPSPGSPERRVSPGKLPQYAKFLALEPAIAPNVSGQYLTRTLISKLEPFGLTGSEGVDTRTYAKGFDNAIPELGDARSTALQLLHSMRARVQDLDSAVRAGGEKSKGAQQKLDVMLHRALPRLLQFIDLSGDLADPFDETLKKLTEKDEFRSMRLEVAIASLKTELPNAIELIFEPESEQGSSQFPLPKFTSGIDTKTT